MHNSFTIDNLKKSAVFSNNELKKTANIGLLSSAAYVVFQSSLAYEFIQNTSTFNCFCSMDNNSKIFLGLGITSIVIGLGSNIKAKVDKLKLVKRL